MTPITVNWSPAHSPIMQCRGPATCRDRHGVSYPFPATTNPLGVKGAGESGTTGSLAAIMNAIDNALPASGKATIDMPATPVQSVACMHGCRCHRLGLGSRGTDRGVANILAGRRHFLWDHTWIDSFRSALPDPPQPQLTLTPSPLPWRRCRSNPIRQCPPRTAATAAAITPRSNRMAPTSIAASTTAPPAVAMREATMNFRLSIEQVGLSVRSQFAVRLLPVLSK